MAEGSTGTVWKLPALDYSLPLPQEPSAMQLSCESVFHRALLYPVNAQTLQQRFSQSHVYMQTYGDLHAHCTLQNMLTVGHLTHRLDLKRNGFASPAASIVIQNSTILLNKSPFTVRGSHISNMIYHHLKIPFKGSANIYHWIYTAVYISRLPTKLALKQNTCTCVAVFKSLHNRRIQRKEKHASAQLILTQLSSN